MDISNLIQQGQAHQQNGNFPQAKEAYEEALRLAPDHPDAFFCLGNLALQAGHLEPGVQYLIRAVNAGGTQPELFTNLATALRTQKKDQDALKALKHGAQLHPDHAPILTMLAALLRISGQHDEALAALERAQKIAPHHADIALEMARLAQTTGQYDRAETSYRQALALEKSVSAYNDFAHFLTRIGRENEAIEHYRAASELAPRALSVLNNLAFQLYALGQADESIETFDRCLKIVPTNPDAHALRAFPLLLKGQYAEGWKEYEWRFKTSSFPQLSIHLSSPAWKGEALDEKTILLISEQGFGDTFQFVRFAKLLAERGARVVVAAQRPAVEVLKTAPGVYDVFAYEDPAPAHDYHIYMMSLPERFGTTVETLPTDVPYLRADADGAEHWRERLASYRGKKVGIVWNGNPEQRNNPKRSCPLEAIAPLAQIEGINLFSLAKNRPSDEGELHPGMIDLGGELNSFSDTAAIIANLDLVISVCTSAAHLAGALAKPTWVMLSAGSDWRWFLDREDSPWYPTARLFRQHALHDWSGLTARIADALSDWAAAPHP